MSTVTIHNPNTDKTEVLDQAEFNKYMSMTNGEVLEWIVKPDQPDHEKPDTQGTITNHE